MLKYATFFLYISHNSLNCQCKKYIVDVIKKNFLIIDDFFYLSYKYLKYVEIFLHQNMKGNEEQKCLH
ncbi:hypothetical protein MHK_008155 [Candidatus Magnetomorum sp. HK-1]|nr:hypothetical protein MHK_008155 [Candidatus Magnetomorum sp. HK-1]